MTEGTEMIDQMKLTALDRGYLDYQATFGNFDCPYEPGGEDSHLWARGWAKAQGDALYCAAATQPTAKRDEN